MNRAPAFGSQGLSASSTHRGTGPTTTEWLFVALGVLAFTPALIELAGVWRGTDYLSHGFMVPVVAGFIAVGRREAWAALEPRRDAKGLLLVAAALVLSTLGSLAAVPSWLGLGVVGAAVGAVWTLRGVAGVRVMAFPLAFLVFMVPPPVSWVDPVILWLQLQVSAGAVEILRAAGFAILRDGNVLVLPGGTSLFVDEACSGITSVVTLIPLGILLAWSTERQATRRALLIACVVPAAMFGNLVRVTGTVWAASSHGVEVATSGFLHDWAGIVTYALACGVLLGVSAGMRRVWPATRVDRVDA